MALTATIRGVQMPRLLAIKEGVVFTVAGVVPVPKFCGTPLVPGRSVTPTIKAPAVTGNAVVPVRNVSLGSRK